MIWKNINLYLGDNRIVMKNFPDNSIDAIITDAPYELGFMGKSWDNTGIAYNINLWKEVLRILKPGGYLLSFGGSRTYHRMACAIEDAGFEIRDQIMWVYGSGFPKSLNIGKAVDKLQGNERKVVGDIIYPDGSKSRKTAQTFQAGGKGNILGDTKLTKGTSDWEGWGTALKPAHEPIVLARKPLSEKTVAENVLKWGVGGINIDGCRIEGTKPSVPQPKGGTGDIYGFKNGVGRSGEMSDNSQGRFPANFIHDGSQEVVELFPNSGGGKFSKSGNRVGGKCEYSVGINGRKDAPDNYGDSGSASRFFYCAKTNSSERNKGCEEIEIKQTTGGGGGIGDYIEDVNSASGKFGSEKAPNKNNHPTVKPIALMKYLIKLVSREGQTVLDPFMGSGSTGVACKQLNRKFIGIELSEDYIKIAQARIKGD